MKRINWKQAGVIYLALHLLAILFCFAMCGSSEVYADSSDWLDRAGLLWGALCAMGVVVGAVALFKEASD